MDKLTNEELIAAAMYCADKNTLSCLGCPAYNHCDENDMFSLEKELAKRLQEASASRVLVLCKDCKYRGNDTYCPMCFDEWYEIDEGGGFYDSDFITHDRTIDEGFCSYGERRTDDDC